MSRPSNPYDNATCESFLRTLKREEIQASTYRDFEDLRERMEEFIKRYYTCVGCTRGWTIAYPKTSKKSPNENPRERQRRR